MNTQPHDPKQIAKIVKNGKEAFENDAEVVTFLGQDGVALRLARWKPHLDEDEKSRGTILMLHGFTEFMEKYNEVVEDFRNKKYHVVTFDWRGQGLSRRFLKDELKGYVDSFSKMVADAGEVYETHVNDLPRPHILLGHSMGGCVGLRVLQEYPDFFDRAVLSAPMLAWGQPILLSQIVATTMVWSGQGKEYSLGSGPPEEPMEDNTYERLTSDYKRVKMICSYYRTEPRFWMGGPTWKWVMEASKSIRRAFSMANLAKMKTPTLVVSPQKDVIVPPVCHEELVKLSDMIKLVKVEGCKHEILMETDALRNQFFDEFEDFVHSEIKLPFVHGRASTVSA